jgi:hypothetical protein
MASIFNIRSLVAGKDVCDSVVSAKPDKAVALELF